MKFGSHIRDIFQQFGLMGRVLIVLLVAVPYVSLTMAAAQRLPVARIYSTQGNEVFLPGSSTSVCSTFKLPSRRHLPLTRPLISDHEVSLLCEFKPEHGSFHIVLDEARGVSFEAEYPSTAPDRAPPLAA